MAIPKKSRLVLVLALTLLFLVLFLVKVKNEMHDFQVNYTAGLRLGQGETIYRPWKPDPGWENDGHWQFKYSPFSALVYLPLSYLPLTAAKGFWYFLILFSIGTILVLSVRLASFNPDAMIRASFLSFLILAKFFLRELQLGQINAVITAILMVMTWLLVKNEDAPSPGGERTAGLLWGLAAALKPYAVVFLPYFILKRKWRALAAGITVLAASLFVPVLFYGVQGNWTVIREWVTSLSESTPALFTSQDNVSLLACLNKWTGNSTLAVILFGAAVALLGVLTLVFILRGKSAPRPAVLECALLIVFIPLLSPLGWDYTFLSAYLAVVLIIRHFAVFPRPWRVLLAIDLAVIALSLYDLLGRRFYGQFMSWSVPTVNFLIIVVALFYLRMKRTA